MNTKTIVLLLVILVLTAITAAARSLTVLSTV